MCDEQFLSTIQCGVTLQKVTMYFVYFALRGLRLSRIEGLWWISGRPCVEPSIGWAKPFHQAIIYRQAQASAIRATNKTYPH